MPANRVLRCLKRRTSLDAENSNKNAVMSTLASKYIPTKHSSQERELCAGRCCCRLLIDFVVELLKLPLVRVVDTNELIAL